MFCPNCGKENRAEQKFCRSCGLKLDAVLQVVADQFPSEDYAAMQRRKRLFEKLAAGALSIAVLIGLALLLFIIGIYKLIVLGQDLLFGSSIVALLVFLLLSAFFFSFPKLFMRFEKLNSRKAPTDSSDTTLPTGKLIEDRQFEPVPSVVENTTDLLSKQDSGRRRS